MEEDCDETFWHVWHDIWPLDAKHCTLPSLASDLGAQRHPRRAQCHPFKGQFVKNEFIVILTRKLRSRL
jgi:hypothetical protein